MRRKVRGQEVRQTVEARITEATVEVFHIGKRVAAHVRSRVKNRHTTVREHKPSAHRRYAEWTQQRITREAAAMSSPPPN